MARCILPVAIRLTALIKVSRYIYSKGMFINFRSVTTTFWALSVGYSSYVSAIEFLDAEPQEAAPAVVASYSSDGTFRCSTFHHDLGVIPGAAASPGSAIVMSLRVGNFQVRLGNLSREDHQRISQMNRSDLLEHCRSFLRLLPRNNNVSDAEILNRVTPGIREALRLNDGVVISDISAIPSTNAQAGASPSTRAYQYVALPMFRDGRRFEEMYCRGTTIRELESLFPPSVTGARSTSSEEYNRWCGQRSLEYTRKAIEVCVNSFIERLSQAQSPQGGTSAHIRSLCSGVERLARTPQEYASLVESELNSYTRRQQANTFCSAVNPNHQESSGDIRSHIRQAFADVFTANGLDSEVDERMGATPAQSTWVGGIAHQISTCFLLPNPSPESTPYAVAVDEREVELEASVPSSPSVPSSVDRTEPSPSAQPIAVLPQAEEPSPSANAEEPQQPAATPAVAIVASTEELKPNANRRMFNETSACSAEDHHSIRCAAAESTPTRPSRRRRPVRAPLNCTPGFQADWSIGGPFRNTVRRRSSRGASSPVVEKSSCELLAEWRNDTSLRRCFPREIRRAGGSVSGRELARVITELSSDPSRVRDRDFLESLVASRSLACTCAANSLVRSEGDYSTISSRMIREMGGGALGVVDRFSEHCGYYRPATNQSLLDSLRLSGANSTVLPAQSSQFEREGDNRGNKEPVSRERFTPRPPAPATKVDPASAQSNNKPIKKSTRLPASNKGH